MKRSIKIMLASAVVMLFGLATSASAQMVFHPLEKPASAVPTPTANRVVASPGLTRIVSGEGKAYSPVSSVQAPGSAGVTAHTDVEVFIPNGFQPDQVGPPMTGFGFETPQSIACVYSVMSGAHLGRCDPAFTTSLTSGGSGTIAIVDAYDDPWIMDDLNTFSAQFGLPLVSSSNFQVVYASGTEPPFDVADNGGWELEESLDVEWAHAMAPNANIVLVEAYSNSLQYLLPAVQVASWEVECGQATACASQTGSGEVVMSWGTSEFSGETGDDSYFTTPGVVYFAAAGDSPGVSWPCSSVNVVCVGGTTRSRMPSTTPFPPTSGSVNSPYASQQQGSWELGGGGSSQYELLPSYQNILVPTLQQFYNGTGLTLGGTPIGVGLSASNRAVPDVSADANPYTGYWVYDSFQFALLEYIPSSPPDSGGWWIVGGTSAANNIVAGIVNLASSTNTVVSGATNTSATFKASSAAELTVIYANATGTYPLSISGNIGNTPAGFGVCGPNMGFAPTAGWNPCTGLGTPNGIAGF